jgi:hypothetical protein
MHPVTIVIGVVMETMIVIVFTAITFEIILNIEKYIGKHR